MRDQNVSIYLIFQGKEELNQTVNYVTDLGIGSLIGFLGLVECFHIAGYDVGQELSYLSFCKGSEESHPPSYYQKHSCSNI